MLPAAKRLPLLGKCGFDGRFGLRKRLFVAADKLPVDCVVCDVQRKRLDIGDINKRGLLQLEIARQETPLVQPFAVGEIVREFDGEVDIGRLSRSTRDP